MFVTPALASAELRPEYSKQVLADFQQRAKAQTVKKDIWNSYQQLMKELKSEKVIVNNQSQLIYMNSLMLALGEITEKEFQASKCKDISNRLDTKFLNPGVSFANSPQHYQDAKNILSSMCK
jgi:hypothetical protein